MRDLIKSKVFIVGFMCGIFTFLCINIFIFFNSMCHHCVNVAGFPIIFFAKFVGNFSFTPSEGLTNNVNNYEWFYPFKLLADILIAVIISFIVGLILKFVWSRIVLRRLL